MGTTSSANVESRTMGQKLLGLWMSNADHLMKSRPGNETEASQEKLSLGDEIQALFGVEFVVDEKEYYLEGDKGRVSKTPCRTQDDGNKTFEITWYRTGLSSTMDEAHWLSSFRKVGNAVQPKVGDEMKVLPSVKFSIDGREYYMEGDQGRVSKDTYATEADGIERFEITWYRSGLTSTMKQTMWLTNFQFLGNSVKLLRLGDEVEVLPNVSFYTGGKEYYNERDKGRVSRDKFVCENDGIEKFEVSWYRTGLASTMKASMWISNFKFIGSSVIEPILGDELQVLPGVTFNHDGKEYYGQGDKGRVSKNTTVTEADGIERFEVTWYRTGLTSTMKKSMWIKNFRFIGALGREPIFGDEMEVLPGVSFEFEGKDFYREGDKGRVSKNTYISDDEGIEKFEVTWYRTGLTSTMKKEMWLRNFCFNETFFRFKEVGQMPRCGDEMEVVLGVSFNYNGNTYYQEGDKGKVTKDVYVTPSDGIERFEVTWYRTGLVSTMKLDCWPRNFRLSLFNSELTEQEHEFWGTIVDLTLNLKPQKAVLPEALKRLTFGDNFNKCIADMCLPLGLRTISFGFAFNQDMAKVALPIGLQHLVFGESFNRSMQEVALPSSLQSLSFGDRFNQPIAGVMLPSTLQELTFGNDFNHSMEKTILPDSLQSLIFGDCFNQSLERVALPGHLTELSVGSNFNQSLEKVTLPHGLETLTLGNGFNQSLEAVTFPDSLLKLTLGGDYRHSMEKVTLPCKCEIARQSVDFHSDEG